MQIFGEFLQSDPIENRHRIKTNAEIAFDGSFGVGLGHALGDDILARRIAVTDRMNIRRRAADVDHEHIAPAFFLRRAVGAEPKSFEHGHRRRQHHVDKPFT